MKQPQDIHERIFAYVVEVIRFTTKLPYTPHFRIILHQLVKSVTSIGANDREANVAESRKDFISKYTIVKKEASETLYWLEIILTISRDSTIQTESHTLLVNNHQDKKEVISTFDY